MQLNWSWAHVNHLYNTTFVIHLGWYHVVVVLKRLCQNRDAFHSCILPAVPFPMVVQAKVHGWSYSA